MRPAATRPSNSTLGGIATHHCRRLFTVWLSLFTRRFKVRRRAMNKHRTPAGLVQTIIWLCTIILLNSQPLAVLAQQTITSATVSGRVIDKEGASLSGAAITATNLDRNQSWTAMSDDQGRYNFLYLPVGNYRLKAEQAGFAPASQELTLSIGQSLDLPLRLSTAGVNESITITSVPVIETVRTQVAETIIPHEIDSLPLNGRNYLDLAA